MQRIAHKTTGHKRRKKKPRNIKIISDDERGKKANKKERRRRQEKESEDKFVADLEGAFCRTQRATKRTLRRLDNTAANTLQIGRQEQVGGAQGKATTGSQSHCND